MRSFYAQFWPWHSAASLRKAIIVSVILHVVIVVGLTVRFPKKMVLTQAGAFSVELSNPDAPPSMDVPLGTLAAPPAPPQPKPAAPPRPAPKPPEPKPKPPEPKKEEPKPKPKVEPVKEEKPKEEKAKKEKPKDEKKPEEKPKDEKPKPDKQTKVAKNEKPPREISDNPMDDMPVSDGPAGTARPSAQTPQVPQQRGLPTGKAGVSMAGGIPSALGAWGGLIQRKVEKEWTVPEGIVLGGPEDGAVLAFWITRDGELKGEPEVVKHAVDKEVAASAIRAIKAAAPYPPLPDSYGDAEVQVFYTFIPTK